MFVVNSVRDVLAASKLRPLPLSDVHGIPTDSITLALVVIPTISRRKHSKSNSAVSGK